MSKGRRAATGAKNKPETTAALGRIAAALDGLPASRSSAIERELLALDRRATYGGGKRGRKWTHTQVVNLIAA